MGVVKSGADGVVVDGDLSEAEFEDFEKALNVLRKSSVQAPVVDLSEVRYISSRAIGSLVTLWVDLSEKSRWFDLIASDRVWSILEKAGVAGVFFKRPKGPQTP